jgi:serine/threonine protein kinase
MSIPASPNATLTLVRKSKLVADDRLRRYLARLDPRELDALAPEELLDRLVDDGLLTPFQADQLGHGRYQGFVLGEYRIQTRIGRGGMGQVFLAEQMNTGRRVAVKVLHKAADQTPFARERFVREALASAKLAHPNIVQVYDASPDTDPPYLVMEYIDGISLQAAVAQYGPLTPAEAAECGRQIALGLQHASDAGLVHRDIKPANVLLDRRGIAKILDLGIVRVVGEYFTQLGQSDVILGTVEYLAPEQALSSSVDGRADIYSLGATLYFLLSGRPPFPEGDAREKILQLAREEPPPLTDLVPGIPAELAATIHRMLAKEPEDRFQWASDAARALAPWATPAEFPSRFFSKPSSTVANEDSPTAAVPKIALQPPPRVAVTETTPAPVADPASGTIEIGGSSDLNAPRTAPDLPRYSPAADPTETESDESDLPIDPLVGPWLTRVLYGILALLLAWAGYVLFMS